MSLTNSPIWFGSGATGGGFYGYEIDNSLRFNDDDSAYLNRTPSSASNRKTWTFSAWIKLSSFSQGERGTIFQSNYGGPTIYQDSGLRFAHAWDPAGTDYIRETVGLFRDPSAWYHVVWWCDTTQAGTRWKIYVNGTEQTLQTPSGNNGEPAQNTDLNINSTNTHTIGNFIGNYFDGYMAEVNFIDGQALDPTSFGETKSGVWIPKSYGGSYGTNGFYLDFSDNSTATALGTDSSGNSNNWSVNGIATTDQMIDTPTNNFAVMNALEPSSGTSVTLSEGNLKAAGTTVSYSGGITSTFEQSSSKWYWEVYVNSEVTAGTNYYNFVGAATGENNLVHKSNNSQIPSVVAGINGWSWEGDGTINLIGTGTKAVSSVTAPSAGDVLGFAIDLDNGNVYFYHNGTAQNSGSPVITGVSDLLHNPMVGVYNGSTVTFNFGQDSTFAGATSAGGNSDANGVGDFKYSVPSGYLALCSDNLPEPVVGPLGGSISTENFNTLLWTGNGSNPRTLSGLDFTADFIWHKSRSSASMSSHAIQDVVRGFDTNNNIYTNLTASETDYPNRGVINSVSSTGYTVNENASDYSTADGLNENSQTFVSWNWKASGSAVSNTDGSITSQVSTNTDAGFSIVSYTGTSANATVGHGLGVEPSMIFVKVRTTTNNWATYVKDIGNTKALLLDTSDQALTSSLFWNNTTPTSSVFSISTGNSVNNSGQTYIAYCFADVDGYSKVGSYTGNYNVNGPFVYTGFRPAFIIIKSATTSGYSWYMMDSKRTAYNGSQAWLSPDQTLQEDTSTGENVDILSNGFKIRTNWTRLNDSGSPTYIYIAFAENPFKYANAR